MQPAVLCIYDLICLPQSLISEGEDDEMGDDDEEEGKTTMLVEDKNKKFKPELHGMIVIIYINITWKHLHSSQSPRLLISKQDT